MKSKDICNHNFYANHIETHPPEMWNWFWKMPGYEVVFMCCKCGDTKNSKRFRWKEDAQEFMEDFNDMKDSNDSD